MAGRVALELGRKLFEFRDVVGFVADPNLAQVALVGGFVGGDGAWSGLHGKFPAELTVDGEWLWDEAELHDLDVASYGGDVALDCDRRVRQADGRGGIDHACGDQAVGYILGFFKMNADGKRSVDGHDMKTEVGLTVVFPACGATQAVALPCVLAGDGGIVLVGVRLLQGEHTGLGRGILRGGIFPVGGWWPDPAMLGAEPKTMAALVGPGIIFIGQHLRRRCVEEVERTILCSQIDQARAGLGDDCAHVILGRSPGALALPLCFFPRRGGRKAHRGCHDR